MILLSKAAAISAIKNLSSKEESVQLSVIYWLTWQLTKERNRVKTSVVQEFYHKAVRRVCKALGCCREMCYFKCHLSFSLPASWTVTLFDFLSTQNVRCLSKRCLIIGVDLYWQGICTGVQHIAPAASWEGRQELRESKCLLLERRAFSFSWRSINLVSEYLKAPAGQSQVSYLEISLSWKELKTL